MTGEHQENQITSEFAAAVAKRYRYSVADIVGDRPIRWESGSGSIVISINAVDLQQMADNEEKLIQPLRKYARLVSIEMGEEIILNFPTQADIDTGQTKTMITDQLDQDQSIIARIEIVSDADLEREVQAYEGSASILRMRDNKGLYCNGRIKAASGASRNDWVGHNAAQYHLPQELSRYLGALYKELDTEVQYKAPLFNGRIHSFHNRVRFVVYGGELCRLVKVISTAPLD